MKFSTRLASYYGLGLGHNLAIAPPQFKRISRILGFITCSHNAGKLIPDSNLMGVTMHITLVEVLNRRVDPATRDDCADVVFHSDHFISRFVAKAPRASRGSELVKDALRQLRRMPEFRSGAQKIRFITPDIIDPHDLAAAPRSL